MDRQNLAPHALLLCASPHVGGSASRVVSVIASALETKGIPFRRMDFFSMRFFDCVHCGSCAKPPHECIYAGQDDCEQVFLAMRSTPLIFWVSPVYFYGLPARCKALVDRSQRFWESRSPEMLALEPRPKIVPVFLAGRTVGNELFRGSSLALKYFAKAVGLEEAPDLCLRGVNAPYDVKKEEGKIVSFVDDLFRD